MNPIPVSTTMAEWANLIESGKKARFSKRIAKKVMAYINEYCDFKVLYSESEGKLIISKAPLNF